MSRLRLVFALLAALLLVPIALLVHKVVTNLRAEREVQQRAVAERVIDEMERELSDWLRHEEERPFGHYRFLHLPVVGGALERSPLADGASAPFVIVNFQIEPDGSVSSPLWPQDPELAEDVLGWRMNPAMEAQRDEILSLINDLAKPRSVDPRPVDSTSLESKLAKSGSKEALNASTQKRKRPRPLEARPESAEALLSQLNRGIQSRDVRTTQTQQSQALNVYNFDSYADDDLTSAVADRHELEANGLVDVSLEPMVGRTLAAGNMLLYRTVLVSDSAFRQGMVIDGPQLIRHLASRVLAPDEADSKVGPYLTSRLSRTDAETILRSSGVSVRWIASSAAPTLDTDTGAATAKSTLYRHQFAEPFRSLAAEIELDVLPPTPSTLYVYSLVALLGFAATVGLFALYRMVAVQVRFAERRSDFVSAVTHELKTPLTAIRMHGEMLRDGVVASEDKRHDYYRVITAESERLTRLINNVLELSRLENRTRRFDLFLGDPRPVLAEVIEVLEPNARRLGFELDVEADNDLPDVLFDRDALLQVLFNLVDNALKYATNAEDTRIILRCREHQGGIKLSVADRGPGVPRRHLREIFEPFYRGESEMTRETKGTGIGLSLVRGLVESMGGSVRGRNRDVGGFEVEILLSPG